MENKKKSIIVVGGGFGGLNFVKEMAHNKHFDVLLVDRNNYHFFPPLLYQVAAAFIEPSNISYPFRKFLQKKNNLRYFMGSLSKVNPSENTIETSAGVLPYDYLILATGTESNFFGMENVRKHALPLKTVTDATAMRNHLLLMMEKAIRTPPGQERNNLLNVVIAGGGPSGVEVAGILAEMIRHIAPKEYPEIRDLQFPIYLVEAGPALLGPMSKKSQEEARRVLEKLGVKIMLNTAVKDYVNGEVKLSNGPGIATHTLIWTSGVTGSPMEGFPDHTYGRGRRLIVDGFCRVTGTQNVFAIGDIALSKSDPKFPEGHPQLAQVAIQQGNYLAKWFRAVATNKEIAPFSYRDKGSMAIISKYNAVADLPKMFIKGFVAWLIWLFVHLIPIAGFRNKVVLAFNWLWSFITNDPTLRLVLRQPEKDADK